MKNEKQKNTNEKSFLGKQLFHLLQWYWFLLLSVLL